MRTTGPEGQNQEDILCYGGVCSAPLAWYSWAPAPVFAAGGHCSSWYPALALGCSKDPHPLLLLLRGPLSTWQVVSYQEHISAINLEPELETLGSWRTISSRRPWVGMGVGEGRSRVGGRRGREWKSLPQSLKGPVSEQTPALPDSSLMEWIEPFVESAFRLPGPGQVVKTPKQALVLISAPISRNSQTSRRSTDQAVGAPPCGTRWGLCGTDPGWGGLGQGKPSGGRSDDANSQQREPTPQHTQQLPPLLTPARARANPHSLCAPEGTSIEKQLDGVASILEVFLEEAWL